MTTTSSWGVNEELRDRLLDFQPPTGSSLRQLLKAKIHFNRPPETVTYPYAVLNLKRIRAGSDSAQRDQIALEVTFYGRDESQAQLVETAADVADQAFTRYAHFSDGLTFGGGGRTRDNVPPMPQPVDRQEYVVRCLYPLVNWPAWLAAVTTY